MQECVLLESNAKIIIEKNKMKSAFYALTTSRIIFGKRNKVKMAASNKFHQKASEKDVSIIYANEIDSISVEKFRLGKSISVTKKDGTATKFFLSTGGAIIWTEAIDVMTGKKAMEESRFTYKGVQFTQHVQFNKASGEAMAIAKKVRNVEMICCVLWVLIGIVQMVFVYTAAAGVWNIVNSVIRLRNAKNIQADNPNVPAYFDERKPWLIAMVLINLILGGVVGVVLVIADIQSRNFVLQHRAAFEGEKDKAPDEH